MLVIIRVTLPCLQPQVTHEGSSPGRAGGGRYNLRPITPNRTAPLAPPPVTWPGFSSDEADEEYVPRLELSEI